MAGVLQTVLGEIDGYQKVEFGSIDDIVDEGVSACLLEPVDEYFAHCNRLFGDGYCYWLTIFREEGVDLELIRRAYLDLPFRIAKLEHLDPKPVFILVWELVGGELEWLEVHLLYILLLLGSVDGYPLGEPVDLQLHEEVMLDGEPSGTHSNIVFGIATVILHTSDFKLAFGFSSFSLV